VGKPASGGKRGTFGHGDLGESLVFVFPLFLLYGVGLAFVPTVNGVDFVSRLLAAAVGHDEGRYLALHAVLAAGFLGLVLYLRRWRGLRLRTGVAVLIEAAIYALTIGSLIVFVMERLLAPVLAVGSAPSLPPALGHVVLAAGAGVYEELVFRVGLFAGGAWLLARLGLGPRAALVVAAMASSLLFSGAHHLGPLGDPWARDVFAYRALAGLGFAAIFWWRSLAHAVYAHFLYDVYVLILRG
jgi:hypothetical protein